MTCPGNNVLMHKTKAIQVTTSPTQNKDIEYKYKSGINSFLIDLKNNELKEIS